MTALRRILALIGKEFVLILKDPKSRVVVIGPPLIQFFVFGYAATFDVRHVRYAVLDECRTAESRRLLAAFAGSESFALVRSLAGAGEVAGVVDRQEARLVLHLGPTFSRDLALGRPARLQVIVDGRNSNVALIALGYVGQIVEEFNRALAAEDPARAGPGVLLVDRAWFNPNLQSRWFIVSALGGVISMVVVVIITSLAVAREREFGTFNQLLVAPFTAGEILVGKSVPGMVFGLLDALLFALGAVLWFEVPFRGTVAALVAALAVFVLSVVGVGLFVSSLSLTMQQGLLGAFVFLMPAVILSGFTTPIENMPGWLQTGTLANPMRYVVVALRKIFLQGAGVAEVWPEIWPMAVIAAVTLPAAAWLFRHRAQ